LRGQYLIMLPFVMLLGVFAQSAPEVGHVELLRFDTLLRQHNIELTKPALLRALKNPNSDVRFLSAMKLAEDKVTDAIPAIRQAVVDEKVPRARVNIALALGLLGDQTGKIELKEMCADRDFVPEFRLYAVRYMFDLHSQDDSDCLAAAEEIVQSKDVSLGDRTSALGLLPLFQDLTADESQRIFNLVLACLDNPEPVVQMAASDALASLGNSAAIPHLEAAIAREQEQGTRAVFEADLAKLRKNAKQ
jgi:HEAT repeat protein